ncbi:MAG TPA: ACP S-malonyltransferase [Candidatus Omnitrophota bacterium]|nr:ACP S-malonyltransferase [Candidatus Omnitrophota bacterium]HRZ15668.1 ACP S-malonyltransferase [Candidatus Omnitrophota bacterium]
MERIAFLFAGQGSQSVGMGKDLYESFPASKAVFDTACAVLGFDIRQLCFEGPLDKLKPTVISQPAIVTTTIAAFEACKSARALTPSFGAGLSLGEYTALIAAGALSLEDGIKLVKRRGEIMEAAARKRPGKMAAIIDLPLEKIREICRKSGAAVANLNCPGQVIISGTPESVDTAKAQCQAAGAKRVLELEVSGGFHSPLMFEASGELKNELEAMHMSAPRFPIVSNYGAAAETRTAEIKQNLVYQMYSEVRWEESVRSMLAQGVTTFYEFGPGRVLKGLMRKIDADAQVVTIEKKDDILKLAAG